MIRRPPSSTRTDALFPYTTRFRSGLFASFAGEFLDLRDPAAPPDCLHPDIGVGYPAGNALAAEVRRRGVNGIVYPSVRDPVGVCLVEIGRASCRERVCQYV